MNWHNAFLFLAISSGIIWITSLISWGIAADFGGSTIVLKRLFLGSLIIFAISGFIAAGTV